jgi:hypothetical protein
MAGDVIDSRGERVAMKAQGKRSPRRIPWALGVALLLLFAAGDRRVHSAPPPGIGIDPFEVLDLQVKPNVMILFDTSGSMKFTTASVPGFQRSVVGGDDKLSRMAQAKLAVADVVQANATKVNFGMVTFVVRNTTKFLSRNQTFLGATTSADANHNNDGPFVYVTRDAAADLFYWRNADGDANLYETNAITDATKGDTFVCPNGGAKLAGYFCNIEDANANYNDNPGPTATPSATNSTEIYNSFSNRGAYAMPIPEAATWNMATAQAIPGAAAQTCPDGVPGGDPLCTYRRPICTPGTDCRYYIQSRVYRTGRQYTWDRAATTSATRLKSIASITCPLPPAGLLNDNPDALGNISPAPCFQFRDFATGQVATYYYTSAVFQQNGGPGSCGGAATITAVGACNQDRTPELFAALKPELPKQADGSLTDLTANPNPATDLMTGTFNPAVPGGSPDPPGLGNAGIRSEGSTPIGTSLNNIRNAAPPLFPAPPPEAPAGAQKNFVLILTDGDDTCNGTPFAAQEAAALYGNVANPRNQAEVLMVAFTDAVAVAEANDIARAGSGGTSSDGFATVTCPSGVPCRNAYVATSLAALKDALNQALTIVTTGGVFSATPSVFDAIPEYVATVPSSTFSALDPVTRYNASAFRSYRASFDANGFKGFMKAFDSNGEIVGWEAGAKLLTRVSATLKTTNQTFAQIVSGNQIQRRIFTTDRNGVAPNLVNLWRATAGPDASVNPAVGTAGSLDEPLFRRADGTTMVLADLQAPPLAACLGTNRPAECTGTVAQQTSRSFKEAREMILAFVAGADVVRDPAGAPTRTAGGEILYRARPWILSESTLSTPAVMTPPSNRVPQVHQAEYLLMRDGPRDISTGNAIPGTVVLGYGLRNPDADGKEAPTGPRTDNTLKPVMSVVYLAANDMLHAFRAGPQLVGAETGGEELWGYVPYDQLPKLRDRLKIQTRTDHVFMMASSVRFGDVFIPGNHTVAGKSYTGKWRRVLITGRGLGGKYYSALDVTELGEFTRSSLQALLPKVLWVRGNPDTQNGKTGGANNGSASDKAAYADLGQTWSTPAIARMSGYAAEFLAFFGSGYGTVANEGSRFYAVDVRTGNIVDSANVGDTAGATFENAIVADPVVYAGEQLQPGTDLPNPSGSDVSAVYVGDIHGRMWKFARGALSTAVLLKDAGRSQPIAVAAALLNLGNPYVFFVSGYDARVPDASGNFQMWAVEDAGPSTGTTVPGFPVSFPGGGSGRSAYRGTVQPLSAFLGNEGVVFFIGTRFNPVTTQTCVSSFDTVIYSLFARNAGTAYATQEYERVKAVGVPQPPVPPLVGDPPPVDQGTAAGGAGDPPQPPTPQSRIGAPVVVTSQVLRPGSSVCR